MNEQKQPEHLFREKAVDPLLAKIEPKIINEDHTVPEYLYSVYGGRYFRPFWTGLFDDEWTNAIGTFFQSARLTRTVVAEIIEGQDVLQLGIASGNFETAVSSKINGTAKYVIEDIAPAHIDTVLRRISPWPNAVIRQRDVCIQNDKKYDIVLCPFLLHEVPELRKEEIVKRALSSLKAQGQAIFIDYAAPVKFNPLKYPVRAFNRLFEPFAESLWHKEIQSYAPKSDKFIWAKKTYCGGLYQIVNAQMK